MTFTSHENISLDNNLDFKVKKSSWTFGVEYIFKFALNLLKMMITCRNVRRICQILVYSLDLFNAFRGGYSI